MYIQLYIIVSRFKYVTSPSRSPAANNHWWHHQPGQGPWHVYVIWSSVKIFARYIVWTSEQIFTDPYCMNNCEDIYTVPMVWTSGQKSAPCLLYEQVCRYWYHTHYMNMWVNIHTYLYLLYEQVCWYSLRAYCMNTLPIILMVLL